MDLECRGLGCVRRCPCHPAGAWFGICVSAILGAGAVIALIGDVCVAMRSAEERVKPSKEDVRTGPAGPDRETELDDREVENSSTE
jgi:hypothetical protein